MRPLQLLLQGTLRPPGAVADETDEDAGEGDETGAHGEGGEVVRRQRRDERLAVEARSQEGEGAKGDEDRQPANPDDAPLHLDRRRIRLAGVRRLPSAELQVDGAAHRVRLAGLQRPIGPTLTVAPARDFVEVE